MFINHSAIREMPVIQINACYSYFTITDLEIHLLWKLTSVLIRENRKNSFFNFIGNFKTF